MSKKRQATTELNHDNWDEEEEQEDPGQFTAASKDRLSGRKILAARRRRPGDPSENSGGIFAGFSGFGQTKTAAANLESSNASATANFPAGSLFGSREIMPGLSSTLAPAAGSLLKFGSAAKSVTTEENTAKSEKLFGDANKEEQANVAKSTDAELSSFPSAGFAFASHTKAQNLPPATSAPIASSLLKLGTNHSNANEDPNALKRTKIDGNGTKFDSAAEKSSGAADDPTKNPEYLAAVKRLNANFLAFLQRHFADCPYLDLSPCFDDYQKHIAKLEQKFAMKNGENTNIFGGGAKPPAVAGPPIPLAVAGPPIPTAVAGPPKLQSGIFGTAAPATAASKAPFNFSAESSEAPGAMPTRSQEISATNPQPIPFGFSAAAGTDGGIQKSSFGFGSALTVPSKDVGASNLISAGGLFKFGGGAGGAGTAEQKVGAAPKAVDNSLAEKFKPPPGSWSCKECFIRNEADDKSCKACGAQNPSTIAKAAADPFMDKFKPAPGSWSCKECFVKNSADAKACVACGSGREGTDKAPQKPSDAFASGPANFFAPAAPNLGSGLFRFGAPGGAPSGASSAAAATTSQPTLSVMQTKSTAATATTGHFGSTAASAANVEFRNTTGPSFRFGAPPVTSSSTGIFQLGATVTTTASSGPNVPLFKFAADAAKTTENSPVPGAAVTTTKPTFAFGGGSASRSGPTFSFLNTAAKEKDDKEEGAAGGDVSQDDSEPYEPPKANEVDVHEEGAIYSKRCKLFYKKEQSYSEKGVGTLHLKPTDDGRVQLIIRAGTALGNVFLNILLTDKTPISKAGSSCVQLVCVPNPPLDPKFPSNQPAVMLIRVKSNDDAEELFDNLEKYKKGAPTKNKSVEPEPEENSGNDDDEDEEDADDDDDEDFDEQELEESNEPHSEEDEGDIQCLD